jgi:HAE1 family hydrophobic/amphiphilic exporter-1
VVTLGLVPAPDGPDLSELRRLARRQVAVALERMEGVAEVRVTGGRDEQVHVLLDRYRMEAHGLTLGEVEGRLRAANVDINAGTLEEGDRVYLVRGLARFRRPEDVGQVVLRYDRDAAGGRSAVRVRDVAEVRVGEAEVTHLVRIDGVEGVALSVYKEAGANTVAVSRTVREALDRLGDDLPGVDVRLVADEAALVEDAIGDVESSALVGIGLAMLVLVLFLRAVGPTLIVAVAVPVSLLATLFFMHVAGRSLNVMTLGGLALGAGMLVDNAIVVVESIFRRLSDGDGIEEAAPRGTAAVAGAIIASTLTTCAVFVPVLFVQGLAARLVGGLSFTVVVSLVVSLAVAIFLIPALAAWLLPRRAARAVDPGTGAIERAVARVLRHAWLVVAGSAGAAALAIWLLAGLGTELLPPADMRQFSVRIVGPSGQRVEATAATAATIEDILRAAAGEHVLAVMSEVGRVPEDDRMIREEQTEENTASVLVRLSEDGPSAREVAAAARPAVETLGRLEVEWDVGGSALARALGTTGPPVVVEIYGQSLEDLRAAAGHVTEALSARPELWNVGSSFEGGPPELRVVLERAVADGLGIDLDIVAATLEAALDGRPVTTLAVGDEEREIVLRLPSVRREELASIPLRTADGARVAVGDVATFAPHEGAREVFRRDQKRLARVTARIAPESDFPQAMDAARRAIEGIDPAPGQRILLAGEEEERARTFRELELAAAMALLLVFMVLAGTFESLLHPLTVTASVPLAMVGVAAILVPLGRPIGVMEMLGLIVLSGVAVNDAILLVDAAQRGMQEGLPRGTALARAAGQRLRPILMTTLTTILALLPLAIGTGEAARLRSPMALTIIGGLVSSTVGSLFVIPCIYIVIDRLRPRRAT